MKMCDFCGFVLSDSDSACKNCNNVLPGKDMLFDPTESLPKSKDIVKKKIDVSKSILKNRSNIETEGNFRRSFSFPSNFSSYIPRRTIALLLVIGIIASPQTQSLVNGSLNQWSEMNASYYVIPESITFTYVREFEIYLENSEPSNSGNYTLVLSSPENRPSWPQIDGNNWQVVDSIKAEPLYKENSAGRMEWSGNLNGSERNHVAIEYEVTVNTIRPELTIEDSGNIENIPDGFELYLNDTWLIDPELPEIQKLAVEMQNGTSGNVIHILKNIFDYIESNYNYQTSSVPKHCSDTLAKGYGDCDDFSILFSSIARAAGIPTWLEWGKIPAFIDSTQECGFQDWGGHAWVNALVPLKNGNTTVVNIDLANSQFLWMPPYRISDWVDDANEENSASYYYVFYHLGDGNPKVLENSYISGCKESGSIKLETI